MGTMKKHILVTDDHTFVRKADVTLFKDKFNFL